MTGYSGWAVLLLLLISVPELQGANLLRRKPEKVKLMGHVVALTVPGQQTTLGRNYRDYLFAVEGKDEVRRTVRLQYRFMHRDGDLPSVFLDRRWVHAFRAVRDPGCDIRFDVLATAYRFDPNGFQLLRTEPALEFLKEEEAALPADTILPCYLATPQDYLGSEAVKDKARSR